MKKEDGLTQSEVNGLIREEINKWEQKIQSLGCPTIIGCHKGKELENHIHGRLQSNINDLRATKEYTERELPSLKQRLDDFIEREFKGVKEDMQDVKKSTRSLLYTVIGGVFVSVLLLGFSVWSNLDAKHADVATQLSNQQRLEQRLDELIKGLEIKIQYDSGVKK